MQASKVVSRYGRFSAAGPCATRRKRSSRHAAFINATSTILAMPVFHEFPPLSRGFKTHIAAGGWYLRAEAEFS